MGGMGNAGSGKGPGGRPAFDMKAYIKGLQQPGIVPGGTKWTNSEQTLYIAHLSSTCEELDLYNMFARFGPIHSVHIHRDDSGACKGIGFVNFMDVMAVQNAVNSLNGQPLPTGMHLIVNVKSDNQREKGQKGKGNDFGQRPLAIDYSQQSYGNDSGMPQQRAYGSNLD